MSQNQPQIPPTIAPPPINQPPPSPSPGSDGHARTWNMLCHLSVLSGYMIPFGNFLGPFLVWQLKKNEIPSVEFHGKSALNFQLTIFIALLVGSIPLAFCLGVLLIPFVALLAICDFVFPIIAAVKANNGEDYKYPFSFEFLK